MKRFLSLLMFLIVLFLQCDKSPSSSDVTSTPIFTVDSNSSNIGDGDSVVTDSIRIALDISGTTLRYRFRWKIDDGEWEEWVDGSGDLLTIKYDDIDPGEHAVTIEVRYGTDGETADSVITFFLAEKPVVTAECTTSITVEAGSDCTLWVAAEGTTPLEYLWYKDNETIDDSRMDTLLLTDVTGDDAGEYVCKVGNRWGEAASEKIVLSVKEGFRVIYSGNGHTDGDVPVDEKVYETGDTVTVFGISENFVKTGHIFTGWNSSQDGDGVDYSVDAVVTMGTDNLTLYAQWAELPIWNVTYNGNGNTGGEIPEDTTDYHAGDTVIILANKGALAKTGNSFAGWNTNKDGNGTAFAPLDTLFIPFDSSVVEDTSITLYAIWIPSRYTVTFDSRGGGAVDRQTVDYGKKADVPAPPEKEDYTFVGWFKDNDGVDEWNFTVDTVVADITLYAKWSTDKDIVEVKIVAPDNGDIRHEGESVSDEFLHVDAGDGLTLTAVPSPKYHFAYWRTVSGEVEWSDSLTAETTLLLKEQSEITAVFLRDSVTLEAQPSSNGSIQYEDAALPGDSLRMPTGKTTALTAVASADYHFAYWRTLSGCVVWSDSLTAETTVSLACRSKITAVFLRDSVTLEVLPPSHGSVLYQDASLPGDSLRMPTGNTITLTAVAATDYHFAYWQTLSGDVNWSDNLAEETSVSLTSRSQITAVFHRDSITLEVQPSSNGSVWYHGSQLPGDSLRIPTGQSVAVTAVPSAFYHFVRWGTVSGDVDWSDSLSAATTVSLTSRSEIEAIFEKDSFTLHIDIDGPGNIRYHGDPIDGDSIRIPANTRDSIECIPYQNDWVVTEWETEHGTPTVYADDSEAFVFLLTGSASISVHLEEQFELTIGSSGNGEINPSGTMTVLDNEVTSISAQAGSYSYFSNWEVTDGSADIADPDEPATTVTLTHEDASIEAVFRYQDTIWVPVTFYDFHSDKSNPEFESQHTGGSYEGMVAQALDEDGKPVIGEEPYLSYYIKYWFRPWEDSARGDSTVPVYKCVGDDCDNREFNVEMVYEGIESVDHDTAFKNMVIEDSLPFLYVGNTGVPSGTYRFEDQDFFPLDGRGFGEEERSHNYSFTMELHLNFIHESGLEFNFTGDDDVWMFIDEQLEMDLGGIHQAYSAWVNLNEIEELVEGQEYPLHLFYCERHTDNSRISITTNVFRAMGEK